MNKLGAASLLLATFLIPVSIAQARNSDSASEEAARALVSRLTVEEAVSQLNNAAPAIPRLEIPAYSWWTEALHGVMTEDVSTTNFPAPIGLAASFDRNLVKVVAAGIAREVRANHDAKVGTDKIGLVGNGLSVWAPNVNIFRDPRWGRGQETYGEDPFLTGQLAVSFVTGMQGPDPLRPYVIATPKHFAVHSGPEATRHSADVPASLHDMEDTYLPAFRSAIVDGKAGSIMCAYSGLNGAPTCASTFLLQERLRGSWGFKGFVVSDCNAVLNIFDPHKYAPTAEAATGVAFRTGVDNECTFGDPHIRQRYLAAHQQGLLPRELIDRSLVRLFTARYRLGELGVAPLPRAHGSSLDDLVAQHRALSREAAGKTMVLLKNDGILPLASSVRRLALIGPLANAVRVLRSSYSSGISPLPVTVLDGLRAGIPHAQIDYVPAGPFAGDGDVVPEGNLQTPDGKPGLRVEYFNETAAASKAPVPAGPPQPPIAFDPQPALVATTPTVDANSVLRPPDGVGRRYQAVWSGYLVPSDTGEYRIGLKGIHAELSLDGEQVGTVGGFPAGLGELKTVHLEKGRRYALRLAARPSPIMEVHLVWSRISAEPLADVAKAAKTADAIVAVVGITADLEGEEARISVPGFSHRDRTSLDLPADEQALLEAAKATGKPLVVVLMNGSAINLAWAKANADAIVEAWYPGQDGGHAVADVLTGKVNPAARLPLTFYRSVDDLPPFADYAIANRTYRYFTGEPVYKFGFGMSYTRFSYGPLTVARNRAGYVVKTTVTNTGDRAGDEVAQLYLRFPKVDGVPNIALRGFQRTTLKPGETRQISFRLAPRDLSSVNLAGDHLIHAGRYEIHVGGQQPGADTETRSAPLVIAHSQALPH